MKRDNYAFLVTVVDGQAAGGGGTDRVRIKIWDKATGQIILDTQPGAGDNADPTTVPGGGNTCNRWRRSFSL